MYEYFLGYYYIYLIEIRITECYIVIFNLYYIILLLSSNYGSNRE